MRGNPEQFTIASANNLSEALDIMASEPGRWIPFAGGTDLMVTYDSGRLAPAQLLDLHKIEELTSISVENDELVIGAMATYQQIKNHLLIKKNFPNLAAAARQTGGIAIQNRGTIGGNIANASPAADTPPALISYYASIEVAGKNGSRCIPYERFHLGYKQTALRPDELICRIRIPLKSAYTRHYFRKVGTRNAQAISKVVMAATAKMEAEKLQSIRIALGSVGPTVIHCQSIEKHLTGKRVTQDSIVSAVSLLRNEIHPIDDIRSTTDYRQGVAENLLAQFLESLL